MNSSESIRKMKKRDGRIVDFDPQRIAIAAGKALKAAGMGSDKVARHIADDVVRELIDKGYDEELMIPDVEVIQDLVEHAFVKRGLSQAAKLYILYRANHAKMREAKKLMMDVQELVSSYLGQEDWRVNENSNSGYSYASLLNHVSGSVIANYALANMYPPEIAEAHTKGDFHLHDLSCGIVGYCAGWSLRDLLERGFQGRGGRASAAPAKHFDTATGQIVNFLSTLQTEWAGAQAFSSFDTLLAPFVRRDKLTYQQLKQNIQQFVFGLNIASRWGQTPFTNLTFDWVVPEDLRDTPVIIGGQPQEETYGEFQEEMDLINRAFLEVMSEGDRDGRIFTFPIPTYNVTKNFNWTSDNARLLFTVTGKYGLPYFQNFINSDLKPGDVRSMCCRLQMDMRELRNKTGGLFGALASRRDHRGAAEAVDGEDVGTREGGGADGALHLERDVVDLEVEEDAQPALAHGVHDGGALRVEERHAHLDPRGLAGEQVRQLEGTLLGAVQRDDDLVACLFVRQHSKAPISSLMSETPCSAVQEARPSTMSAAQVGS